MIITCKWADLIILMVYMEGQIENSKRVSECEKWINEWASMQVDWLSVKQTLKDG